MASGAQKAYADPHRVSSVRYRQPLAESPERHRYISFALLETRDEAPQETHMHPFE